MSLQKAFDQFEAGKTEAIERFRKETASLRTGRVKPDSVEHIMVEYYGAHTALNGLASIANSDARTLVISPWDQQAVTAIEKAINQANIGVMPTVDGNIIRLSFPSLTEELRAQTIKQLHARAEEAKVQLRQGRDEGLKILRRDKEEGDIPEDDFYKGKEKLDNMIAKAGEEIEALVAKKETDIKTI